MPHFPALAAFIDQLGEFTPQPDIAPEVAEIRLLLNPACAGSAPAQAEVLERCASLRGANARGELKFSSSVALARLLGRVLNGHPVEEIAEDLASFEKELAQEVIQQLINVEGTIVPSHM